MVPAQVPDKFWPAPALGMAVWRLFKNQNPAKITNILARDFIGRSKTPTSRYIVSKAILRKTINLIIEIFADFNFDALMDDHSIINAHTQSDWMLNNITLILRLGPCRVFCSATFLSNFAICEFKKSSSLLFCRRKSLHPHHFSEKGLHPPFPVYCGTPM